MKKQILILTALCASVFISNAQISNNSFEVWGMRTNTIGVPPLLPDETFSYSDPVSWSTGNQATGHSQLGNGFYVTQDTNSRYDGTSSTRLESNEITILGNVITIPGLLVSGEFSINPVDFATGDINPFAVPGVGFPVTGKPSKFVGYYKYAPMGVDTFEIACALVDSARNQVAFGILRSAATVGSFTRFEIDLTYTSCNRPDTICIIAASSPFTSGASTTGADGSVLWVDSFGVSYTPTPNVIPYANNDTVVTYKNTPLTISTLLGNDGDCDGGSLSIVSTTIPLHGSNTNTASSVTYTPTSGYVGNDIFTYNISDGTGGSAVAFVVVNVLNNVGIDDQSTTSISLYPNPANNMIQILGMKTNSSYIINDLSGKTILQGIVENNNNSIDVSSLNNGSYVIKVDGFTKKFNIVK